MINHARGWRQEIEDHINAVGSRAIAISSSSSCATTLIQREKSAILEKLAAAVLKAQGYTPADKISLTDVVAVCVSVCHNRLPKLDLQQYSMFALWQFIISRFLVFFYMLWLELIGAGK
jgi:hypothetical protein